MKAEHDPVRRPFELWVLPTEECRNLWRSLTEHVSVRRRWLGGVQREQQEMRERAMPHRAVSGAERMLLGSLVVRAASEQNVAFADGKPAARSLAGPNLARLRQRG